MKSFRGQASWAKMTSPRDKTVALACHFTKKCKQSSVANVSLYKLWVTDKVQSFSIVSFIDETF